MAIGVSTWNEFIQAYQGTETEIEILADLNCNDNPLSAPLKAGSNKTINGNGHNINRLGTQTTLGASMIQAYNSGGTAQDITWNKVNFLQIISNESSSVFSSGNNHRMVFNDCMIQGQGTAFGGYQNLTRCSLTWQGGGLENTRFTYCWIHLEQFRSGNPGSGSYEIFGPLDTCYLEGEITHAANVTSLGRITEWISNSCINITTHEGPYWSAIATGGDFNKYSVLNKDKFKGNLGGDYYCVQVTDAQMHNAAYLASVGFDIVS